MLNQKQAKAVQEILQQIWQLSRNITKSQLNWLLRSLLIPERRRSLKYSQGFVLPTVTLLLLIMSLLVAALLIRSLSRTSQVVGDRQQKVVRNAATPAIDRAKAKLEYLFQQDQRLPAGLASDIDLESMLLNDGVHLPHADYDGNPSNGLQSPYQFGGETQLDLDGDGTLDNAWSFEIDTDGDGVAEKVAYSILLKTEDASINSADPNKDDRKEPDDQKAPKLVVRNGPINLAESTNSACQEIGGQAGEEVWDFINSAVVRKAFQVTALVVGNNKANRTVATLEMQQDREANLGNKWGAWFRNDLEIFPGPQFRWNGAMHTEGNLIIGDTNKFKAFLISSPKSCLYNRFASEITIGGRLDEATPPFLGQMVNGTLKNNNYDGSSEIHVFGADPLSNKFTMDNTTDSVNPSSGINPVDISLDPVVLFTQNVSQSRTLTNPNNAAPLRDTGWKTRDVFVKRRIYNTSQVAPYLDDTYRADNRYGTKPTYDNSTDLDGQQTGVTITATTAGADDFDKLTNNGTGEPSNTIFGLDGYWERRARGQGLRIIVGQRLELGNTYGWNKDLNNDGDFIDPGEADPLYPPNSNVSNHQQRQWRTLRDNLAAVQATAVYHHTVNNGDFPVACLATTAHPGTQTTIANSTTFNNISINGVNRLNTDFFTGNGTNGWEFNPPAGATTEDGFATAIATGQPLRIALTNLAYFAGDPFGAFPPRQDTAADPAVASAGARVHPHTRLSMWGNFSDLRRVISLLDNGTTYTNLSIADKSTLHTASCSLGMLAYKIQSLQTYDYATNQAAITAATGLDAALQVLSDNTKNNGEVRYYPTEDLNGNGNASDTGENLNGNATGTVDAIPNITVFRNGSNDPISRRIVALDTPPSANDYILGLQNLSTTLQPNRRLAEFIHEKEQVRRDRQYGFSPTPLPVLASSSYLYPLTGLSSAGYNYSGKNYSNGTNIELGFDYTTVTGNNFFGFGPPTNAAQQQRFIRLAKSLDPTKTQPKYPSLFYLFPVTTHNHQGIATPAIASVTQPPSEPYISDTYIFNPNPAATDDINHNLNYRVLTEANIAAIAIEPRNRTTACNTTSTTSGWCLPDTMTDTNIHNKIVDNGNNIYVPLLDKGMFNGREMMGVRTLDIDLNLLRRNSIVAGGETWFPYSSIIYAFREDAVREDAIARPSNTPWTSCDTATEITAAVCSMNAVGTTPQDPPVNPVNGISPKPVDFYPDPDRRPHGFRLRNGRDLRRIPTPPSDFILNGLSFISDNPVYIVGDGGAFNLHNDAASGSQIEEFSLLLDATWSNFYNRGKPGYGNLNTNFAREGDTWRTAEIIADAITILSGAFVDGNIAEGIRRANNSAGIISSYRTLNAPTPSADWPWVREDGSASNAVNNAIPIKISANNFPVYRLNNGTEQEYGREVTPRTYMNFEAQKGLIGATANSRINATIVSGIVPSRVQQAYGGLHNFPRFLENWGVLNISGSLVQLNFSTSATAPYDQDSWEPGIDSAVADELFKYYSPPTRQWGYDVGLQYAPAGPVARRFVTLSNARSEFYRELPLDDPYIFNLRCAVVGGEQIDETADCP